MLEREGKNVRFGSLGFAIPRGHWVRHRNETVFPGIAVQSAKKRIACVYVVPAPASARCRALPRSDRKGGGRGNYKKRVYRVLGAASTRAMGLLGQKKKKQSKVIEQKGRGRHRSFKGESPLPKSLLSREGGTDYIGSIL